MHALPVSRAYRSVATEGVIEHSRKIKTTRVLTNNGRRVFMMGPLSMEERQGWDQAAGIRRHRCKNENFADPQRWLDAFGRRAFSATRQKDIEAQATFSMRIVKSIFFRY
jgi:hypothetical protein